MDSNIKYVIGIDAYNKDALAYCLGRRLNGEFDVILAKTMRNENEFKKEVANLAKYFNADISQQITPDSKLINKKRKRLLHKTSVIRSLSIGQVIAVGIAHTWKKDCGWSDYSEGYYKIEELSRRQIICRSEKFSSEMICIIREDLDIGRFELRV